MLCQQKSPKEMIGDGASRWNLFPAFVITPQEWLQHRIDVNQHYPHYISSLINLRNTRLLFFVLQVFAWTKQLFQPGSSVFFWKWKNSPRQQMSARRTCAQHHRALPTDTHHLSWNEQSRKQQSWVRQGLLLEAAVQGVLHHCAWRWTSLRHCF